MGFSRTAVIDSIAGDIVDLNSIRSALTQFLPDVVFNFASQTDLGGQLGGNYDANVIGVKNLLQAVSETSSVKRVIWASSQLVNRPGFQPANDTSYDPVGEYGRSKMQGEMLVRAADGGGKEWIIIRPTTVWGPGMSPHYLKLLSLIQRGLYFHVGHKPLRKSYSYIENLVEQLTLLATVDASLIQRKTMYVADSEPIELHSWCNGFAAKFGKSIPTMPLAFAKILATVGDMAAGFGIKRIPFSSERLNNICTEYVFDTAPIESICGRTRISNEEGVHRTADWYLSERDSSIGQMPSHAR